MLIFVLSFVLIFLSIGIQFVGVLGVASYALRLPIPALWLGRAIVGRIGKPMALTLLVFLPVLGIALALAICDMRPLLLILLAAAYAAAALYVHTMFKAAI